jgi:hypothetical protein
MQMHPLTSSNLAAAGHDPETRRLRVKFRDRVRKRDGTVIPGGTYELDDMDQADFESLLAAASAGSHYHQHLRHLPWRKVEAEPEEQAA